jgi:hypothetical protein
VGNWRILHDVGDVARLNTGVINDVRPRTRFSGRQTGHGGNNDTLDWPGRLGRVEQSKKAVTSAASRSGADRRSESVFHRTWR